MMDSRRQPSQVFLVPGRGVPLPEHWLSRWRREHPDYRWVQHRNTDGYDLDDRVAALAAAVDAADGPVVLVAHSAGCVTVGHWAVRRTGPVRGALLVTPPDLDRLPPPTPGPPIELPRTRLPFPSILVASRNDEVMSFDRATVVAGNWGARLVDAGAVGHLNTAAGFGPWPLGERLLAELRAEAETGAGRRTG